MKYGLAMKNIKEHLNSSLVEVAHRRTAVSQSVVIAIGLQQQIEETKEILSNAEKNLEQDLNRQDLQVWK